MGFVQLLAGAAIAAVMGTSVWVLQSHERVAADVRSAVRRPSTWLVGLPALSVVLLVGVPFIYIHTTAITPPKPLSFSDLFGSTASSVSPSADAATATASAPAVVAVANTVAGDASTTTLASGPTPVALARNWTVGQGTQARYRVDDTTVGQTQTVVGSTPDVTGTMEIDGSTVSSAQVVVNMQTVTCNCVHDSKYHEMLETDKYPTSTFDLTTPIDLGALPADGEVINVPVTGNFTIHGVTRSVSFTLSAVHQSGRIAVNGEIPVKLEDYNINSPNAGSFGGLSNCFIEFLVAFDPGAQ